MTKFSTSLQKGLISLSLLGLFQPVYAGNTDRLIWNVSSDTHIKVFITRGSVSDVTIFNKAVPSQRLTFDGMGTTPTLLTTGRWTVTLKKAEDIVKLRFPDGSAYDFKPGEITEASDSRPAGNAPYIFTITSKDTGLIKRKNALLALECSVIGDGD